MNKKLWRLGAAMTLVCATMAVRADVVEIEGVKLEPSLQLGAAKLVYNGAGLRTRAFFKVYVAALYVPQKSADVPTLLAQKGARRIAITMLRDVDGKTFAESLNDGLKANHAEAQLASLKPQLDAFKVILAAVGDLKKGDVIHIDGSSNGQTAVSVNGQARGPSVSGDEFYACLLRVWLGDKPVDAGLKKAILGA